MTSLLKIFFLLLFTLNILAQNSRTPKIVIGIVVDQMRYDYLERFYNDFEDGGFKELINNGSNFTNCNINYIPTATGPGHASIYTGTTPYHHGIIANNWTDKLTGNNVYCCEAEPNNLSKLNINSELTPKFSPEKLLATTIGDQIKLSNNGISKVISISIKDRAAILSGGQAADVAYWYDYSNGNFTSSTYYLSKLPNYVNDFNNSKIADSYLNLEWNLLKPVNHYLSSSPDNHPNEVDVFYENKTSFPHSLKNVPPKEKYSKLTATPWGNQILVDFVKKVIANEDLGTDEFIDLLAISFSSTDVIGHEYGPNSFEVKDTYLRLDAQIRELLTTLNEKYGKENYLLFLTSDHGVLENTEFLKERSIDAGFLNTKEMLAKLEIFLQKEFKVKGIIKNHFSRNIYLDYNIIDSAKLNSVNVENKIKKFLLENFTAIAEAYTRNDLEKMTASREGRNYLLNGFNKNRSADILYSLRANYLTGERERGAQHGSPHNYDKHIPLIFYGSSVPNQTRNEEVYIVDIASTIADFIGVNKPSNCIGIPLLGK